jgi:DNA-binding GntR family transcriptional regulator
VSASRRFFRANRAFHRSLFSCCNTHFLAGAIEAASQRAHGTRFISRVKRDYRDAACRENPAKVAALEHGDRLAVVQLCLDHLPASKNAYVGALAASA